MLIPVLCLRPGNTTSATDDHGSRQRGEPLLENAAAARDRGNVKAAANVLKAYAHEVEAQRGKAIPTADADLLIVLASGF